VIGIKTLPFSLLEKRRSTGPLYDRDKERTGFDVIGEQLLN
jgi:hypothetical protein